LRSGDAPLQFVEDVEQHGEFGDGLVSLGGRAGSRFVDEWVILAPTRWSLRRAVRLVNETLAELKVEQHPDKTFIGREAVVASPPPLGSFQERVGRLYEQGASVVRIGQYVRRWKQWVVLVGCPFLGVSYSHPRYQSLTG